MNSKEWWDIYRFQDCGPDPFIAPVVSDNDIDIKPYERKSSSPTSKWKDVLVKVATSLLGS